MTKVHRSIFISGLAAAAVMVLLATPVGAQTIVDDWSKVSIPPAPQLKPVKIDSKTTALLVLDILKTSCNTERRPRCVESLPKLGKLVADARSHGVPVIYSLAGTAKAEDILPPVVPKGDEPMVTSGPDKFVKTDLEKILNDKGIKTVIVVGTTAEGAVLYTASGAALRGFNVIVPIEGSTASNPFGELATAWILANAPSVGAKMTLTKMDMIAY